MPTLLSFGFLIQLGIVLTVLSAFSVLTALSILGKGASPSQLRQSWFVAPDCAPFILITSYYDLTL